MRLLKYIAISIALICVAGESLACWGPWTMPEEYHMYRVCEQPSVPTINIKGCTPAMARNCEEWQRLTSATIPLEDIYEVVYNISLEEFEEMYWNSEYIYPNKFAEWITKQDSAIMEFLLLAKTNEYIRVKRNSRWYYPSMRIMGARMTIEEIAERALSVQDARLRDRYLLQAIRALFSLSRYEECIALWNNEVSRLPEDNLMRQLIQPYIAGAEFRVNGSKRAMVYFAQVGDVNSMLYCAGRTGERLSEVDALDLICQYAPNAPYVAQTLQKYIRYIESMGDFYWDTQWCEEERDKLCSLCLRMTTNKACDNPAMWYYTAAFLMAQKGDTLRASDLLGLAEKSKSSAFIDESIKVLRIYLDAKLLPYNAAYENKLFAQLKWLDAKVVSGIDDEVRRNTAHIYTNKSHYYWSDMMRRILLVEVCPRMIKAGKTTRALQLANMADNRKLGLVDKIEVYDYVDVGDEWVYQPVESYTMEEYRYSYNYNRFDYNNSFFEMIDSLGVDVAVRYVDNVRSSKAEFDSYLNARSYTNSDYLDDIVGTQYLRNMKYREAVEYLGRVDKKYYVWHSNVYMDCDPFSIERREIKCKADFRYDFARDMYALEHSLNLTEEPNRRAELLLRYAVGLKNSFDACWGLTQYYRGVNYWGQVCEKRDWKNEAPAIAARRRVEELVQEACDIATCDEVAANIQYALCNYKTVATRYPNTTKGELVRGSCDHLADYHITSLPFRR